MTTNGHTQAVDWATMPEWITSEEAAELSSYGVQYVRKLARAGRIGAVKKGRDWWIDPDKFKAYLDTMNALGPAKFDPRGHDGSEERPG